MPTEGPESPLTCRCCWPRFRLVGLAVRRKGPEPWPAAQVQVLVPGRVPWRRGGSGVFGLESAV